MDPDSYKQLIEGTLVVVVLTTFMVFLYMLMTLVKHAPPKQTDYTWSPGQAYKDFKSRTYNRYGWNSSTLTVTINGIPNTYKDMEDFQKRGTPEEKECYKKYQEFKKTMDDFSKQMDDFFDKGNTDGKV